MLDERVLVDDAVDVAARDVAANLQFKIVGTVASQTYGRRLARRPLPADVARQGHDVDALGDVDGLREIGNVLQRSLNPVENRVHNTRTELDRERLACAQDWVANGDGGCKSIDYVID